MDKFCNDEKDGKYEYWPDIDYSDSMFIVEGKSPYNRSMRLDYEIKFKSLPGFGLELAVDRVHLHKGDSLVVKVQGDLAKEWSGLQNVLYNGELDISTGTKNPEISLIVNAEPANANPFKFQITTYKG